MWEGDSVNVNDDFFSNFHNTNNDHHWYNGLYLILIFSLWLFSSGYGHISPNTRYGRSFCIVHALIGIPICGILLSALGDQFKKFKDKTLQKAYGKFKEQWQRKAFNIFFIFGLGMLFFVVIPAAIFRAIEGWSYHDAWYYSFITLTTIGFGDFVVGKIFCNLR